VAQLDFFLFLLSSPQLFFDKPTFSINSLLSINNERFVAFGYVAFTIWFQLKNFVNVKYNKISITEVKKKSGL
jgi:hypothetical protein